MTPAARVQAAIGILDEILAGAPAERALTGWARRSRYAGSKDRAAVRDHVFDALRCRRSLAALGGAKTGRGLMLGACRRDGIDPDSVFSGARHAPPPLSDEERRAGGEPRAGAEALDLPDWLWPRFRDSLGPRAESCARALQRRAPVHLRVNMRRTDAQGAIGALAAEGIECARHPQVAGALVVRSGARRIRQSGAYRAGLVELQDAASQAVVGALPLRDGMRVLDYCAGGGGKTLAMAARARLELYAHDAAAQRLRDLPERARRAGIRVALADATAVDAAAPFDLVLCDVPCSGSGAWRRTPEAKWLLSPARLAELTGIQAAILDRTARLVAPGGVLAYVTCSVLVEENDRQIQAFAARHAGWSCAMQRSWSVSDAHDGFFLSLLTRDAQQDSSIAD